MPSSEATASNGVYTNGIESNQANGHSHSGANGNGSNPQANQPLNVIIVGAGVAGLALASILGHSGHKVVVLEAAPVIAEVGAGINCSPNLTRLLSRWGFDKRVRKHTNSLTRIDLRRWKDGEFLGAATLMPEIERRHGAPQYAIHRADLHRALMEEAEEVAEVRINSMVTSLDFDKPSVTLSDGSVLEAGVVIGADGMKSTCRRLIYQKLGLVDKAKPTGDAAFRACIPLELVTDPELRAFMTEPVATRWMGPDRHVQAYPIRHGNLYNMVMCHPDRGFSEESWTAKASKQEILDHFGSWDPVRLRKLLDLIPDENVMKWRLCEHDPLPTWVMGKVVLLGDACHPMLPYVAQGAAQAIEDTGVLCLALNRVSKLEEIPTLLKAFEVARKSRAEHVASTGGATRRVLHLHDGPEQQARDEKFKSVSKGGENPDLLGDAKAQSFLWGYDPEKEFLDNFESLIRKAQDLLAEPTARVVDL
ncbi:hypothetical protein AYL99_10130 [Fonsecaea erecta]|uniref:FAD-binding domain-containing protein n=1 Tax=Fonsecaea erecta TaxID=1367422 RepID=A0A178Z870_9EURO|nr:hypothetical protein AYL99_10130 [Fonsecaea erecta]OAP55978.1 hypothetical protein AYL99_10130 [Fonsecaea erecta]